MDLGSRHLLCRRSSKTLPTRHVSVSTSSSHSNTPYNTILIHLLSHTLSLSTDYPHPFSLSTNLPTPSTDSFKSERFSVRFHLCQLHSLAIDQRRRRLTISLFGFTACFSSKNYVVWRSVWVKVRFFFPSVSIRSYSSTPCSSVRFLFFWIDFVFWFGEFLGIGFER